MYRYWMGRWRVGIGTGRSQVIRVVSRGRLREGTCRVIRRVMISAFDQEQIEGIEVDFEIDRKSGTRCEMMSWKRTKSES